MKGSLAQQLGMLLLVLCDQNALTKQTQRQSSNPTCRGKFIYGPTCASVKGLSVCVIKIVTKWSSVSLHGDNRLLKIS